MPLFIAVASLMQFVPVFGMHAKRRPSREHSIAFSRELQSQPRTADPFRRGRTGRGPSCEGARVAARCRPVHPLDLERAAALIRRTAARAGLSASSEVEMIGELLALVLFVTVGIAAVRERPMPMHRSVDEGSVIDATRLM